jgi:hypothetical protein
MNKTERRKEYNKLTVEAWKGYGEIVIVDYHTKKRMFLKIDAIENLPENIDTDTLYGCNGFTRMRKLEEALI